MNVTGIAVAAFIAGFGLGMAIMARMLRQRFARALQALCDLVEAERGP